MIEDSIDRVCEICGSVLSQQRRRGRRRKVCARQECQRERQRRYMRAYYEARNLPRGLLMDGTCAVCGADLWQGPGPRRVVCPDADCRRRYRKQCYQAKHPPLSPGELHEVRMANLGDENSRRAAGAGSLNAETARAALSRLGADCPARWVIVAEARIADPQAEWSAIADRLGMTKHQVTGIFRRLAAAAA